MKVSVNTSIGQIKSLKAHERIVKTLVTVSEKDVDSLKIHNEQKLGESADLPSTG